MTILILSIMNETPVYNNMKKLQNKYIHSNELIEYYFVSFKRIMDTNVSIDGDMIYVKGNEDYMNILEKTIVALDYLINTKNKIYDFIIRTNVSTIFNYNNLLRYLTTIPSTNVYLGKEMRLNWLDEKFGITEFKINLYSLKGLMFFQGICIIMSYDVVKHITENMINLKYEIIDDVAICMYIKTYLPKSYDCHNFYENPEVSVNGCNKDSVVIRNILPYENRENEITNMELEIQQIYNK